MLELHTFGTVGLRTRDLDASQAMLVQPKRLALLVYLALAPRRRCRRRDQAVALFWPDLDGEHARNALSQSLRYIRRALGDEILISQGEEEIGVDGTKLWCDAIAFGTACDEGRLEQALELYRGPFLDGFFVADASPDFETWATGERSRLKDKATQAAVSLSERADQGGDLATAVVWSRKAAALSPDDESVAARLIERLARSGDRLGAVNAYEALRQRLQDQHGITPSPQTRAVINWVIGS